MKQIAVCVKETNDGYSSDFLYKSSYFVSEGVVTDIRLSWISNVLDTSTNELREQLKETTPLRFIKFTKEFFYLVILKMGQTSRWNDNVAVYCQVPLGVCPTATEWDTLIQAIDGVLEKKELLAKPESWTFLDSLLQKNYECEDVFVEYAEGAKPYACRYLSRLNSLSLFLLNYYQPGYQNYEAVVLISENQKQTVVCKPSVVDLTKEALKEMAVFSAPKNTDGWLAYTANDTLLDKPIMVAKSEPLTIYWKKPGCRTISKTGGATNPASFQVNQDDCKMVISKKQFKITDDNGHSVPSFKMTIDGTGCRNGEIELPVGYSISNAAIRIALQGVILKADKKILTHKILFAVLGLILGLAIGLIIGLSRTPSVVYVPAEPVVEPFSCEKYFKTNTEVWSKASIDSCEDLHGVFELLVSYDFEGLQTKKSVMTKYEGMKDLVPVIAKAAELGLHVDSSGAVTSKILKPARFKERILTAYLETFDVWKKEDLDVFDADLFNALYHYTGDVVKNYNVDGRTKIKTICEQGFKFGNTCPDLYSNSKEITFQNYMTTFKAMPTSKKETPVKKVEKPVKSAAQGADD
jgi:hypothetical protein